MKFKNIIGVIGILIALIALTTFEKSRSGYCKSNCAKALDEEFKSLILDKKLIGENNKGKETLILFTDNKDTIYFYEGFWHSSILPWCDKGDSLIKTKGRFDYKIIKPDRKSFAFNYGILDCNTLCK